MRKNPGDQRLMTKSPYMHSLLVRRGGGGGRSGEKLTQRRQAKNKKYVLAEGICDSFLTV